MSVAKASQLSQKTNKLYKKRNQIHFISYLYCNIIKLHATDVQYRATLS